MGSRTSRPREVEPSRSRLKGLELDVTDYDEGLLDQVVDEPNPVSKLDVEIARVYVVDAQQIRLPSKAVEDDDELMWGLTPRQAHYIYHTSYWWYVVFAFCWMHMILAAWEPPVEKVDYMSARDMAKMQRAGMTGPMMNMRPDGVDSTTNTGYYTSAFQSNNMLVLFLIECGCLAVYYLNIRLLIHSDPSQESSIWTQMFWLVWNVNAADLFFAVALFLIKGAPNPAGKHAIMFRFSRVFRPYYLVFVSVDLKKMFSNIYHSLAGIFDVSVIMGLYLVFMTFAGYTLFSENTGSSGGLGVPQNDDAKNKLVCDRKRDKCGNDQFKTWDSSFRALFILITTANFPDVMMESYHTNPYITGVFFFFFIFIGLFFLMSLVLAVVYNSYHEHGEKTANSVDKHRDRALNCAWNLLSTVPEGKLGGDADDVEMTISYPNFTRFLNAFRGQIEKLHSDIIYLALTTGDDDEDDAVQRRHAHSDVFSIDTHTKTQQSEWISLEPGDSLTSYQEHELKMDLQDEPSQTTVGTSHRDSIAMSSLATDIDPRSMGSQATSQSPPRKKESAVRKASRQVVQSRRDMGVTHSMWLRILHYVDVKLYRHPVEQYAEDMRTFGSQISKRLNERQDGLGLRCCDPIIAYLQVRLWWVQIRRLAARFVSHAWFERTVWFLIWALLGTAIADTYFPDSMRYLDRVIIWAFMLELLSKFLAFGFSFMSDPFYLFDSFVILLSWAVDFLTAVQYHGRYKGQEYSYTFGMSGGEWVRTSTCLDNRSGDFEHCTILDPNRLKLARTLVMLRLLRLFRFLKGVARFRTILKVCFRVLGAFIILWAVAFCISYFFAIIGMEMFAGVVTLQNVKTLSVSPRHYDGAMPGSWWKDAIMDTYYYDNNMNSLYSSFIVFLELAVVNNWHVITEMYVGLSGTRWTYLYFYVYYLVAVVIVVNVLTAFVIDAFVEQYNADPSRYFRWEQRIYNSLALMKGRSYAKKYRIHRPQSKALLYIQLYGETHPDEQHAGHKRSIVTKNELFSTALGDEQS